VRCIWGNTVKTKKIRTKTKYSKKDIKRKLQQENFASVKEGRELNMKLIDLAKSYHINYSAVNNFHNSILQRKRGRPRKILEEDISAMKSILNNETSKNLI